jgi:hypothetical protein
LQNDTGAIFAQIDLPRERQPLDFRSGPDTVEGGNYVE